MKKTILFVLLMVLSAGFTPNRLSAATSEPISIAHNPEKTAEMPERVKTLLNRVDEIRAMDRSTLSRSERKELRKELRAINTELKSTGNGLYLSIGAIIIIILLLILIL